MARSKGTWSGPKGSRVGLGMREKAIGRDDRTGQNQGCMMSDATAEKLAACSEMLML